MPDYELYVGTIGQRRAIRFRSAGRRGWPAGGPGRWRTRGRAGGNCGRPPATSRVTAPARIAVAIEVPHGPVVDMLLEHGCSRVAINPKQLDRFRDRHTVAGAKDDRARCVCRGRCPAHRPAGFSAARRRGSAVMQLRELSASAWGTASRSRGAWPIGCASSCGAYYPQLLALSPAADQAWLWDAADAGADAGARRSAHARCAAPALLARHHIRRLSAAAVHAALQEPSLPGRRRDGGGGAASMSSCWCPACSWCASNGRAVSAGSRPCCRRSWREPAEGGRVTGAS